MRSTDDTKGSTPTLNDELRRWFGVRRDLEGEQDAMSSVFGARLTDDRLRMGRCWWWLCKRQIERSRMDRIEQETYCCHRADCQIDLQLMDRAIRSEGQGVDRTSCYSQHLNCRCPASLALFDTGKGQN